MRKFSHKTKKSTLPGGIWVGLILGILAILAIFTKGGLSNEQPEINDEVKPFEGVVGHSNILDHGFRELAVSFMMKSLYARPLEIIDIDSTASLLADSLGLDENKLSRDLKSERSFVWVGRRLPESRADAILQKGIKGIYGVEEAQRFYPAHRSSAHVLGFMEESNGLAGVEFFYDRALRRGSDVVASEKELVNGHLQLTIDLRIQDLLASELGKLLHVTGAPSATGILMNVKTGAILAMVSLPDYDPNYYWESKASERLNRAVSGSIDVGGFQYLFGLASGHEKNTDNDDQIESVRKALRTERIPKGENAGNWGTQYRDNVLSAEFRVFNEDALPAEKATDFVKRLGLFGETGIDLPEADDDRSRPAGQTSPINLLKAFAVLVNGGTGITPHLGEAIIDSSSGISVNIEHPQKHGLIKLSTSRKIVELLIATSKSEGEALFLESMKTVNAKMEDTVGIEQMNDTQQARYQTVMVAFTPYRESGVALLVALDQAVISAGKKTAVQSMGEVVMSRMGNFADEKVQFPGPELIGERAKLIYEDWLETREYRKKKFEVVEVTERPGMMPDLKGMSLRRAMRNLQQLGLKIRINGSGRVVAQEPGPGVISGGEECLLTLQAEI